MEYIDEITEVTNVDFGHLNNIKFPGSQPPEVYPRASPLYQFFDFMAIDPRVNLPRTLPAEETGNLNGSE